MEERNVLPLFNEYDSSLMGYSSPNKLQSDQYNSIIQSKDVNFDLGFIWSTNQNDDERTSGLYPHDRRFGQRDGQLWQTDNRGNRWCLCWCRCDNFDGI